MATELTVASSHACIKLQSKTQVLKYQVKISNISCFQQVLTGFVKVFFFFFLLSYWAVLSRCGSVISYFVIVMNSIYRADIVQFI